MLRVANASWNWCLMLCWEQLVFSCCLLLVACCSIVMSMIDEWYVVLYSHHWRAGPSSSMHHPLHYHHHHHHYIVEWSWMRRSIRFWCLMLLSLSYNTVRTWGGFVFFVLPTASGMALSMPVTGTGTVTTLQDMDMAYGDRVLYCCLLYLR